MSRAIEAKKVTDALKKIAKTSDNSFNELRLIVALERAVARLERHPQLVDHLVFKGGFVLLKTVDTTRFTRDVDALAIGILRPSIVAMVEHALNFDLNDGLWFGEFQAEDLIDQGPYGGYRFHCAFQIGDPPKEKEKLKKLSRIHIDVGFGDALKIIPKKRPMESLIVDSKPISWSIYPLEYIFAEKLEALFSRGSANSRAKDVYDMPLIFPKCDRAKLRKAITLTFEKRKTPVPKALAASANSFDLSVMKRAWGSVNLGENAKDFESSWVELIACLEILDSE